MKSKSIPATILTATAVLASTIATANLPPGSRVTAFRSYDILAEGFAYGADGFEYRFAVRSYDELYSGLVVGTIWLQVLDGPNPRFMNCYGTHFANAVTVNQGSGNTSVNITVDPNDPWCSSRGISAPITISVTGTSDGEYRDSTNSISRTTINGTTSQVLTQSDGFTMTYAGTIGLLSGSFTGVAYTARVMNRTIVRSTPE